MPSSASELEDLEDQPSPWYCWDAHADTAIYTLCKTFGWTEEDLEERNSSLFCRRMLQAHAAASRAGAELDAEAAARQKA